MAKEDPDARRVSNIYIYFLDTRAGANRQDTFIRKLSRRDYENLLGYIYIYVAGKGEGTHMGSADVLALFSIDTPFTAQGMNRDEQ